MKSDGIKFTGHLKLIIKRENGAIEIQEYKNNIHNDLLELYNDKILASVDNSIDDKFASNEESHNLVANLNKDGITLYDTITSHYWTMLHSTTTFPTTSSVMFSATFTGTGIAIPTGNNDAFRMGYNIGALGVYATNYSYRAITAGITLGAGDTLTAQWTITVS